MDQSLALLPAHWNPRVFLGRDVPGLGAILTLVIIFVTGVLTANLVGGKLVIWGEQILIRIPIVRSIYSSVKQVSDTILSPNGNAFRKALLVQYPRKGVWTIAFLTGVPPWTCRRRRDSDRLVAGVGLRADHPQPHVRASS